MDLLFTMLVPFLMLAVALWGLVKRVDLWGALTDGAEKGLKVSLRNEQISFYLFLFP